MARMFGQRWRYEVGNSTVIVDNAYTLFGWVKERLIVNDDEVQTSSSSWTFFRAFSEPWLTRIGEEDLEISMIAGLLSVQCGARLGHEKLTPVDILKASWVGDRESWPLDSDWRPTREGRHSLSHKSQ